MRICLNKVEKSHLHSSSMFRYVNLDYHWILLALYFKKLALALDIRCVIEWDFHLWTLHYSRKS